VEPEFTPGDVPRTSNADTPMTEQERSQRALNWLRVIQTELIEMMVNDHIFRELRGIISANKKLQSAESIFYEWMGTVYAHYAAVAVRRQLLAKKPNVSFHRLLLELKEYPHLIPREYCRAFDHYSDKNCDECVGSDMGVADPSQIQKDINSLIQAADRIREYADKIVAHRDEKGLKRRAPIFLHLSECLIDIEFIFLKYLALMTGEPKNTLLPAFDDEWKSIFRFTWIEGM